MSRRRLMMSLLQQLIGTISFASDSVSKTYGNGAFTNTLTNTGDGTVSYASSNTSVATVNSAGQVTIVGAGSATITATVTDGATYHYPVSSVSYTLTVAKKSLTVTAKAQTISYGGSIATGTSQVTTSGLVSGDSLTAVTLTPSGSGVTTTGTITPSAAGTSKGAGNYDITYVDGNLTITAVPASVTAAPTAKTSLKYNGSGQALVNAGTASGGTMMYKSTTTNSKPSSTSGFSSTIPTGSNVGTYYVWYYVQGDSNHTDTAISSTAISVSIGQGTGTLAFGSSSVNATKTPSIYGLAVSVANCGWEKTTAKTLTGFNIFRSFSNKGMATSSAVMKLQFVNNTGAAVTTTIKVGPCCEGQYDFVYIAAWNASDVSPTSSSVPANALYNGKSVSAEWTDVQITIPTGTNTLQIVYRKDSSVDNSPDCGYVALPFDVAMGSITNGLKKTGNGTVTYSSSNTSVATVNSSTGAVTIVGTGTATITASMATTTQYSGATATYTITVSNSTDCTEALTVTLSKDAGSASISSATVALKTGSTTLATLSSGNTVNIAWGLEYTLSAADIDGFFPPADVTKDWADTTSKSVTMQYTYIPYKVVVQSGSVVTSGGTKVVVNI